MNTLMSTKLAAELNPAMAAKQYSKALELLITAKRVPSTSKRVIRKLVP